MQCSFEALRGVWATAVVLLCKMERSALLKLRTTDESSLSDGEMILAQN